MGIKIIGAGKYLPKKVMTNDDFAKILDTSDEWITSRTGIKERHIAVGEFTYQMGANAAKAAIQNAGINPNEIDLVIACSCTSDFTSPPLACIIAGEVGIPDAACFEINGACAGFVMGVDMAKRYLEDSDYKTALVVATEQLSKMQDYTDRSSCILFGDGAGACVLQKSDGIYHSVIRSDPSGRQFLFTRGLPPSDQFRSAPFDPLSDGFPPSKDHFLYQDGRAVYKFATQEIPRLLRDVCKKAGLALEDVTLYLPHQANLRILETAAKHLGLPIEKFYINIERYGNMSSACIPVEIAELTEQGKLHHGDIICMAGFGAGMVSAASVFEW